MKYRDAVLESLAPVVDAARGSTALAATDHWTNVRRRQVGLLPGVLMHELRDAASGQPVFASPSLQNVQLPALAPQARPFIQEAMRQGRSVRIYTGRNERWVLRVFETKRTDASFLQTNGRALLPYLLLAAPFVLLAVWLSVRNGLRPLQQLARRIAQRGQDDLQPVGFNARHRELQPLEQSLDHLFAQLRQKVERERAFVQDAAHEIRTPLAVINAQAHVLARLPDPAERAQAQTQTQLEQAIARTSHLTQQLLDLAALDDAQRPAPRDIDAAQWRRAAIAQAAPATMAKQIEFSLDAPDHLRARLDLPALESVVHNLIDNAVRYGHAGGTVAVGLRVDDESVAGRETLHLSVQDDGPGIAAAERGQVFERFYRSTGQEATTGTGLGLAIVRQAVLRMGGEVWVGDGVGSRGGFFMRIPLSGIF